MNNRPITHRPGLTNPYTNGVNGPRKPTVVPPGDGTDSPARAVSPKAATVPQKAPTTTLGLSEAEQQMIDRYFPASPDLSMRLYGPGRNEQTINPGAVGRHLDVSG